MGYRKPRSSASPPDHNLDECHFRLTVAAGEVHGLAAHDAGLGREVGGHHPVRRDVGERRLYAEFS